MRWRLALLSTVAALAGGLSSYALMHWWPVPPSASSVSPVPEISTLTARLGEPVPHFALADLEGQIIHFPHHFTGQMLLINIWASWCAPCVEEIPELARFAATQDESGVQVVGIALDHQPAVRDFMQRIAVPYLVVLELPGANDASVTLGNEQGLLPYSVLIDRQGHLLKQKLGPFRRGEVEQWVKLAINNNDSDANEND